MQSSTPNQVVVSFLAAGTPVFGFGSMCTTLALEFLVNRFRRYSRRSPGLMPHNATVWASAYLSCAKRSEFWATASTLPPLPAAGLAFPFSLHARRKGSERGRVGREKERDQEEGLMGGSEAINPARSPAPLRQEVHMPHPHG